MLRRLCSPLLVAGLVACSNESPDPPSESTEKPEAATPAKSPTPAETTPTPEPPPPEPARGFAVVPGGTALHIAPADDAPTVTFDAKKPVTVRVIGEHAGYVEVETLAASEAEQHCVEGRLRALEGLRLRFFATREQFATVLREPMTTGPGQAKATVRAGSLAKHGGGSDEVGPAGVTLPLPVDPQRVGQFYEPSESFAPPDPERVVPESATLLLPDGVPLGSTGLDEVGDRIAVYDYAERDGIHYVEVGNRCVRLTVRSDRAAVEGPDRRIGLYAMKGPKDAIPQMARNFDPDLLDKKAGILGALQQESDHFLASPYGGAFGGGDESLGVGGLGLVGTERSESYRVSVGSVVYWPGGQTAGEAATDLRFSAAPRDEGTRRCFDVTAKEGAEDTPESSGNPKVELCFDAERVEKAAVGTGTIGLGNIGLIESAGAGSPGRDKKIPRVRQAKATVKGAMDKDIVRRIVRSHINEVRYCYNQGLVKDPALEGRVAVQFTIGPSGKVSASVVSSSSLADKAVGNCIAKAVKRWKFTRPAGGGSVVVTYPFVLSPG